MYTRLGDLQIVSVEVNYKKINKICNKVLYIYHQRDGYV